MQYGLPPKCRTCANLVTQALDDQVSENANFPIMVSQSLSNTRVNGECSNHKQHKTLVVMPCKGTYLLGPPLL
jgi:hypothetical protein